MSQRVTQYKNMGKDGESLRRSRGEQAVSIRKEKRDDVMFKRRSIILVDGDEASAQGASSTLGHVSPEALIQQVLDGEPDDRLESMTQIRKILSVDIRDSSVDIFVAAGIVPVLIHCLRSSSSKLQLEALLVVSSIVDGTHEQTQAVVEAGAVPFLLELLNSHVPEVSCQALMILGNIIAEGSDFREHCIGMGLLSPLLKLVEPSTSLVALQGVAFVLFSLCRVRFPPLPKPTIQLLLPALAVLIGHEDESIIMDAIWAICYLAKRNADDLQIIIDSELIGRCVQMLAHPSEKIKAQVMRALGNVIMADGMTQLVVRAGVLQLTAELLVHPSPKVSKEAMWFISNVAAGTKEDIQAIFDTNVFPIVVKLLAEGNFEIQMEAAWVVGNIAVGGDEKHIWLMIDDGAVSSMCDLLAVQSYDILLVVLDALKDILIRSEPGSADVCRKIEECGGLDKIEKLLNTDNQDIFHSALWLYDTYFHNQGEDESEGATGIKQSNSQFVGGSASEGKVSFGGFSFGEDF